MNWISDHGWWRVAVVAGIAALAAELGAGVMAHRSAEKALGELAGRKQERDELARRVPAPDETVAQALARDLAQARAVLGRYEVLVRGTEPERWAAPLPVKSIDAHFELAAFVDRARTAAAQAHVALPPGEHFGFASYASEGPEPELIPAVFRQRVVADYLLDALFKAGPDTLIALQRERPRAVGRQVPGARPAKGNPGAPPAATDDARDFLPIDGGVLVRSPGDGPREFFRVEFAGSTPALRELVNRLADFGLPLAVRSVEMEPLAPATVGRSRFVVTVELVGPTS